MALWTKITNLEYGLLKEVEHIYGDNFPIHVRNYLAHWIETQPWNDVDVENPQHKQKGCHLVASFLQQLENSINQNITDDKFIKMQLTNALENFKQTSIQNPLTLLRTIQTCLAAEMSLVSAVNQNGQLCPLIQTNLCSQNEISSEINTVLSRLSESQNLLDYLRNIKENSVIQMSTLCSRINLKNLLQSQGTGTPTTEQSVYDKQELENTIKQLWIELQNQIKECLRTNQQFLNLVGEILLQTQRLEDIVLGGELITWKRQQQLAGNGQCPSYSIDVLQNYCEALATFLINLRQQMNQAMPITDWIRSKCNPSTENQEQIKNIMDLIDQCSCKLISEAFVVEKQPPQVMKTNSRFPASVRFLTGKAFIDNAEPIHVDVNIIGERQANNIVENKHLDKNAYSGEILNNHGVLNCNGPMCLNLNNMQLKKIKRAEKKGTESVMDEKFTLYFTTKIKIQGINDYLEIHALSLPIVVIVHGNQEPHAQATIFWDNAFAKAVRKPFEVSHEQPWHEVATAISMKFELETKKGLNEENLNYLAEKALGTLGMDFKNQVLNWTNFAKDQLPGRGFTFWEWLYAVMKLTKHLEKEWTENRIMGFVQKKKVEVELRSRPEGTFLLRFSDSELGGISICFFENNHEVKMIKPLTIKDLWVRALHLQIDDLEQLVYLYPDIPKKDAFKTPSPTVESYTDSNGYVKPIIRTVLPPSRPTQSDDNSVFPHLISTTPDNSQIYPPDQWNMEIDSDNIIFCNDSSTSVTLVNDNDLYSLLEEFEQKNGF